MTKNKLLLLLALLMTAATGAWAQTTVNGLFTVNADGDQVQFASGNLRYTSGAWSFFDHQYDYYADYSADSWDKFGWSTSGTTYGMSTSTNDNLYKGDFVDWGNAVGTGWRTLSNDEWAYVVNTRSGSTIGTTANARFAKAVVCDVMGLIIFPDDYAHPNGVTAPTGINETGATGMDGNSYDATAWALMESAGCVFLPAAGGRYNYSTPTLVVNAGNEGCYWSSTSNNSTANFLNFKQRTFYPSNTDSPRMGYSVRLVKSVTTYAVSLKDGVKDAAKWTATVGTNSNAKALPVGGLSEGNAVTLKYNGRLKVKNVTATTDAAPAAPTGNIVDLSKLTADYEAQNGDVLTGTLGKKVKISIADGATVTLDNATINGVNNDNYEWAGLNCLGNATIVLKDGTTNTVKGFHEDYPGIHVLEGKTLTIQGGTEGTGKLTASPFDGGSTENSYGAGIGGGYGIPSGDISIEGGTVTATGGQYAAGIGGGDATCGNISITGGTVTATGGNFGAGIGGGKSTCGNISITGGTVTATGGQAVAGIGSGYDNTCGNITIASTVKKVTATKGEDAPYSIGKGTYGSCGTVTIGGTKYWENNAAVNDGDTYLGQATIIYPEP